jgi:hypothetical protein
LTACSAEVNRFGLRFVRVHLTGVCLRSVRRSPKIACSAEVVNSVHLRSFRSFSLVCKQHHAARSRVRPSIAGLGCALRGRWVRPSVAGAGCSRPSQARPAPLRARRHSHGVSHGRCGCVWAVWPDPAPSRRGGIATCPETSYLQTRSFCNPVNQSCSGWTLLAPTSPGVCYSF